MLMRVLSSLATMSTLQGRKQLVEIVCEQADLDAQFDVSSHQVGPVIFAMLSPSHSCSVWNSISVVHI